MTDDRPFPSNVPVQQTATNEGAEAVAGPSTRLQQPPGEIGGPVGPEPTRFGDWERKGRCSDF